MPAWYKTGTISVVNGSPTITGSSTIFVGNVKAGDTLKIGAAIYEITAVASNTSLTIGENYPGATASGLAYAIQPTSLDWSLGFAADAVNLAGMATEGMAARVAAGTYAARAIQKSGAGLNVTQGDAILGNPTIALADDVAAVEGLTGTGLAARTAANTWETRTITGTADEIAVTNGDGAGGNPTIAFPATVNFGTKGVVVSDTGLEIRDDTDVTRIVKFQASGLTAGTTRTLAFPDADGTLALAGQTQPLSALLTDIAALGADMDAGSILIGAGADNMSELPVGALGTFLRVLSGGVAWDAAPLQFVVRNFGTSGVYTPTARLIMALAIATGGGGGGGGVSALAAAHMGLSGAGGGNGSSAISVFTAADIGASKYATIGTGGAGGVGNASGAAGGTTGLGTVLNDFSLMRANGGNGGGPASRSSLGIAIGAPAAAVGAPLAMFPISGAQGRPGVASYATTLALYAAISGDGAASMWGDGAPGVIALNASVNGATGAAPGSGGSGAAHARATVANANGGAGANGSLLIIEVIGT